MTLWLILTLISALTLVALVYPLLVTGKDDGSDDAAEIEMFRQQISEIEVQVENGTLNSEDAKATRREIERRILTIAKRQDEKMTDSNDRTRMISIAITGGWIVVGSVLIYGAVGSPDIASEPRIGAIPPAPVASAPLAPPTAAENNLASVDSMVASLAARLQENPDDVQGWQMLGWSLLRLQDFPGAAEAYGRAASLVPDNPEVLSLYGEALVRTTGGVISDAAKAQFERSLSIDPMNPRSRFFMAMVLDQDGQRQEALDAWIGLLADSPADAEYRPGLVERIREQAAALGVDVSDVLAPAPLPLRGPTAEDIEAANDMATEDRQAMIMGMVESLAARLEETPDDIDGWMRLIRSYAVLGNEPAARQALDTARRTFANDADKLATVNQAAATLGL